MVGRGMQDDLASNLRSKVKKSQFLPVPIFATGSLDLFKLIYSI